MDNFSDVFNRMGQMPPRPPEDEEPMIDSTTPAVTATEPEQPVAPDAEELGNAYFQEDVQMPNPEPEIAPAPIVEPEEKAVENLQKQTVKNAVRKISDAKPAKKSKAKKPAAKKKSAPKAAAKKANKAKKAKAKKPARKAKKAAARKPSRSMKKSRKPAKKMKKASKAKKGKKAKRGKKSRR